MTTDIKPKPFDVTKKNPTHVVIEMFGGDNNLDEFVDKDMQEMLEGMSEDMSALCLVDYYGKEKPAQVFELTKQGQKKSLEDWKEINTGDPKILGEFLSRALATYSSDTKIAIGFWDHGTGIFDEQDPEKKKGKLREMKDSRSTRIKFLRPARSSFLTGNLTRGQKAMLHDETDNGLLTNREAGRMLASALNGRKVSMIFSDTCLNGMVEVTHEFAKHAEVIVASEDLEPGDGWDYKRWFGKMAAAPPVDSASWAKQAVDAFGETYEKEDDLHPCTLGAFKTDNNLAQAFKELIKAVDAHGRTGWYWMRDARENTQSFSTYATYDLLHFTETLKTVIKEEGEAAKTVREKADALTDALKSCRVHSVALGDNVPDSHGLAFWFPYELAQLKRDIETYRSLSFDLDTNWTCYLRNYYNL
ncbi:MAG: clostripain-related cysteine peptidase [Candidatus Electronema sp. V4]|uniref:clostripain-related cysteine peptidase n=1 Tax=Candidatus Electronema sp. V4 TaxID=3454756 RepID=UPI00405555F9